MAYLISIILDVDHVDGDGAQNDKARQHVHFKVFQAHTTRSKDHFKRYEELQKGYKKPYWDYIGRPEKEKCVKHVHSSVQKISVTQSRQVSVKVYLPDYSNDAPSYMGSSLNVKKFMQSLSLFFLPYAHQHKVEDAVEEDHDKNEDISIVFRLVNCYYKTEPFHQQGENQ